MSTPAPSTTAVAKAPPAEKPTTIKAWLSTDDILTQVQAAMPQGQSGRRLVRAAITALTKQPKLQQSDQTSFFTALLTGAQMGLCPDGREGHLVPFWSKSKNAYEVVFIPDYKGLAKLVFDSGAVEKLHADVVRENDEFEENLGQVVKHQINRRKPRGEVYAVYAIATFKSGGEKAEVMSTDEVESIRERSKSKDDGPWVTDWCEQAKKTVFKRLSKWLPLSPQVRDAIDRDNDDIDHETRVVVSGRPVPVNRPRIAVAEVVPTAGEIDAGELQSWAEDNEVTFGEVVGWLKPVGKPATWADLTPDEIEHAMKNRDAMKVAVEGGRGNV